MAYAYVSFFTNRPYGTLYVGVTSDLPERAYAHRSGVVRGFTESHGLKRSVWYEPHEDTIGAITREERIKRWHRDWKINLLQSMNRGWNDLFESSLDSSVARQIGSRPSPG